MTYGRTSKEVPNLQPLTCPTKLSQQIRQAFKPEFELFECDYKELENHAKEK